MESRRENQPIPDARVLESAARSRNSFYEPCVAKKANRPKSASSGIAQAVIRRLNEFKQSNVVDLGLFRQSSELALKRRADDSEGLDDLHPLEAVYTQVVNTVNDSAAALSQLPEFTKLVDRLTLYARL